MWKTAILSLLHSSIACTGTSPCNLSLDIVNNIQSLFLKLPELQSLRIIVFLHVCLAVIWVDEHLFNAANRSLVLLVLRLSNVFVKLEENYLERMLLLQKIHNLKVLLVKFGLGLVDQEVENLHDFLIRGHALGHHEQRENTTKEHLKCPYDFKEEDEDGLWRRRCVQSQLHFIVESWWSLISSWQLNCLHK